ncbi:MAG: hypothetical protein RLZZ175_3103 [Bacteroidota bacterium]|jgi:hypothetical protein
MAIKSKYLKLLLWLKLISRKNYSFNEDNEILFSRLYDKVQYDDGSNMKDQYDSYLDYYGNFYLNKFMISPSRNLKYATSILGEVFELSNSKVLKITVRNNFIFPILLILCVVIFVGSKIYFIQLLYLYILIIPIFIVDIMLTENRAIVFYRLMDKLI